VSIIPPIFSETSDIGSKAPALYCKNDTKANSHRGGDFDDGSPLVSEALAFDESPLLI
jgi:hypothetical protein